jgi:hypothetical protein
MITRELSVWGPGQDYVLVAIDLVGPEDQRTAVIGGQPAGITVSRGTMALVGEFITLGLATDTGYVDLRLSLESAVALAEALCALARNPGGRDN